MNPEMRQLIDRNNYHQGSIRALAALLPAEDAALDALLVETQQDGWGLEAQFVLIAALSFGRAVDARHLVRCMERMPNPETLGAVAWHMAGDVPEQLLAGVRSTRLRADFEAMAMLIGAAWCQEHRGGKLPADFMAAARATARRQDLKPEDQALMVAVAEMTQDAGLTHILGERLAKSGLWLSEDRKETGRKLGKVFLSLCRLSFLQNVPEEPERTLAQGSTLRRAVERVGRNEPCPCGSGRKYKHCCHDKDQDRLRHSSAVAGKTVQELRGEPEEELTELRLKGMNSQAMARLDSARVPPELMPLYLGRLGAFKRFDQAVAEFQKLGCPEELEEAWAVVVWFAAKAGQKETIRRLLATRPGMPEEKLEPAPTLLLAEDDPARTLRLIEQWSHAALTESTPEEMWMFARGLLFSKQPALGILVARSMVPVLPSEQAFCLFAELLEARDELNLTPDDPFGEILDQRFLEAHADGGKEAAALREAQGRLESKMQEVRELKESLARMQKEVARRETPPEIPAPTSATALSAPAVDERALQELRQKVEGLKSALKERHSERNELRRELQKAHADLEGLRQTSPTTNGRSEEEGTADQEEDWLLPEEAVENHPLRVIEFPKHFQESLASLPRSVGRGTLTMLGRLAAGEPTAFAGAVRLKACPSVMRQRIGIDFRLLFRLLPDRVQVVDLIPRQDLERKIKTLL